jgi:hypothetical protein
VYVLDGRLEVEFDDRTLTVHLAGTTGTDHREPSSWVRLPPHFRASLSTQSLLSVFPLAGVGRH